MESSIYRLRTQDVLVLVVLSLLMLGVVMVQSAASSVTNAGGWGWNSAGTKQFAYAAVSLAVFLLMGRMDYGWLKVGTKFRSPIFWLCVVAAFTNLVVMIPHVGKSINGARRWLPLGPLQFEPSELAKWAAVLYVCYLLTRRPVDMDKFFRGFLPAMIPVAVLCLLVVIQDYGTATLIALCCLTMLLAGRVKMRYLLVLIPPALAAGMWFLMHKQYRWRRVMAFENPYADPQNQGYHMIQSLLSFSTGGLPGRGLGNGIQKLGYLPEDTTDFIFSVICEELGLFGALLTVALFLGLIYVAWQVMREKKDEFGKMLAFGVCGMVSLQAVINIAVSTVSVPTKGLSLPLISSGGSGLIITSAALGLMLSVCRHDVTSQVVPAEVPSLPETPPQPV
jgi:cell division protein FtsW